MSSSDSHVRCPYNLRSRSKVVRPIPPTSESLAAATKPTIDEIEDLGRLWRTEEELDKYLDAQIGYEYTPPTPLSEEELDRMNQKYTLLLAELGISYLNAKPRRDSDYELVKGIAGHLFLSYKHIIYHINFEAKLENEPDAKAQLFFCEVVQRSPGNLKVRHCCSLGLSGSSAAVTGLNGCEHCGELNHPKNVRFTTR